MHERNPSNKHYKSVDQMNGKLTVGGGVRSGIRLMIDEDFFVCIDGKIMAEMGLLFIKLSLMMKKEDGNETSGVPQ